MQTFGCCHNNVVCRHLLSSSVIRVYCDKTTEIESYYFYCKKLDFYSKTSSKVKHLVGGLGWDISQLHRAICEIIISRKWDEKELRSQLITNRKCFMGFRFVQKAMTLNDLKRSRRICKCNSGNQNVVMAQRSVYVSSAD